MLGGRGRVRSRTNEPWGMPSVFTPPRGDAAGDGVLQAGGGWREAVSHIGGQFRVHDRSQDQVVARGGGETRVERRSGGRNEQSGERGTGGQFSARTNKDPVQREKENYTKSAPVGAVLWVRALGEGRHASMDHGQAEPLRRARAVHILAELQAGVGEADLNGRRSG
eukprot:scaffold1499_cov111-Isochrysis_galbana.AAC.5